MVEQATICESCGERRATMRCTSPAWRHYQLCDECAAEFNRDPDASNFVPVGAFATEEEEGL